MKPAIKICGLMRPEDVSVCCSAGAAICGFVTEYPLAVPWNLTREECAALLPHITAPAKSCVVTGGGKEKICSLALALKPDFVQLHYKETLDDTKSIVRALAPHGIRVIKTIPVSAAERLLQFGTEDVERCAAELSKTGVYAILVDSRGPANAAAGGAAVDLSFFRLVKLAASCPVILAGGITPDNCRDLIAAASPDLMDIMTGVELAPGVKSPELIRKLFEE